MQRKDFIKLASLGFLSIPIYSFGNNILSGKSKKVIIIGAGMAGAAAARKLTDVGCEVVILEARNRIGGRIHTNTDWGFNIELGANWIHNATNADNPLMGYANRLGIQTHKTNYSNIKVYDQSGDKIGKLRLGLFYQHFEKMLGKQAELIQKIEKDISLRQAISQLDKQYSEREQAIVSLIEESYSNNIAASLEKPSAKYYLSRSVRKENNDFLVSGGYGQIVSTLLENMDTKLNNTVLEIRNNSKDVKVITNQGAFDADFVLVTVPVSILQNQEIQFTPALPEWKMNSFSKMHMGIFNKVVMEFHEKFWEGNADFQCYHSEHGNAFGIAVNYHHYKQKPVLIAMPVDNASLWVEQHDIETIKKTYQNIFHKAHPGKEIEFKNVMVTKWKSDEFSKGSYSHVPVGATENDFEALKREVGRIHFAGEATHIAQHATVQGAYNSGIREALKIINS